MTCQELYEKCKQGRFLLAGPCAIESEALVMQVAEEVKKISEELNITYVFK